MHIQHINRHQHSYSNSQLNTRIYWTHACTFQFAGTSSKPFIFTLKYIMGGSAKKNWVTETTKNQCENVNSDTSWKVWSVVENNSTIKALFNPLNPELNPICYLLALLGAHHFLHVSRIRVKWLTLRVLMSYIYIYIWSTYSWCF